MVRKTDKYLKRRARIWERGHVDSAVTDEYVRRETWWILLIIPIYSRDTVVDKPR